MLKLHKECSEAHLLASMGCFGCMKDKLCKYVVCMFIYMKGLSGKSA